MRPVLSKKDRIEFAQISRKIKKIPLRPISRAKSGICFTKYKIS